jgi:hypothetical protein
MQFITLIDTSLARNIGALDGGTLVEERVADPTLGDDDIRSRIEGTCRRTPSG